MSRVQFNEFTRNALHVAAPNVPMDVVDAWILGGDVDAEHAEALEAAQERLKLPAPRPKVKPEPGLTPRATPNAHERSTLLDALPYVPPAVVDAWLRGETVDEHHADLIQAKAETLKLVKAPVVGIGNVERDCLLGSNVGLHPTEDA